METPPPGKRRALRPALVLVALLVATRLFLPGIADRSINKVDPGAGGPTSDAARKLHASLLVGDLHADCLLWGRDLSRRARHGHVDVPRLLEGNVAIQCFFAVTKTPWGLNIDRNEADSDMIFTVALAQGWPLRSLFSLEQRARYIATRLDEAAERSGGSLVVVRGASELRAILDARAAGTPRVAGILGIEGAHVLEGKLENVGAMFDAGYRIMAPSHFFDTEVGGSSAGVDKGGLTELGRQVVAEMERRRMIVDLAHASDRTIDDVLAVATRPVLVSHTGVKATCPNNRNLSDDQLRAIAGKGGLVGIAYFPIAVCGGTGAVARAIQHAVSVAGVEHVALGSDFDGAVTVPFDVAGLAQLTSALMDTGLTEAEIRAVMGENLARFLEANLP